MLNFGNKNIVGIDIGTASIKLVELSHDNGHFELETYGVAELTYDSAIPQEENALAVTTSSLGELMKKANIKTKKVVASLPASTVFVTVIEIPPMEPEKQKKAIEFEANKIVPLPLKDMTVSWNIIPPAEGEEKKTQSVLLTAVPNHVIANYVKVVEALKLKPLAIEVEASALIRSLVGQDNSTVMVLDMGSKTSTVNLIDRGYIFFSKNINIGGEAITKVISQVLGVDLDRGEKFKKSMGLLNSESSGNIPQTVLPVLDSIKSEIEHVINLTEERGRSLEKIILTGGGARLIGLDKFLSEFNIPVTIGNPWARVVVSEEIRPMAEELGPALAVCVGLAMREEE